MADGIQISTQVLVDTAEKVRSINNALDTKLEEINKSMNDLSSTWKSDAGEEIRAAMNALNPRFEEYKTVVESYGKQQAAAYRQRYNFDRCREKIDGYRDRG